MTESKLFLSLFALFSYLSFQAVGGGAAVLPEMQRSLHDGFHLDDAAFVQAYGLGQLVPGPNMLMVIVLGYRVAGPMGALIAFVAFFLPASLIAFFVARFLRNHRDSPWVRSMQKAFAPLAIGLMAAGVYAMGKSATTTWMTIGIAVVVFAVLTRSKINPAWLVLGCAIFGALFLPKT